MAFIGSAKNKVAPLQLADVEIGFPQVQDVGHVVLAAAVVAADLEQGERGDDMCREEYSWISLATIIEGSSAARSMTHMTLFSISRSMSGILCTA